MKEEKEHFHVFEKYHKDEEIEHYDVCILGGGPAGLTSALYSSRYGFHTALIAKDIGGMANLAHKIENYPGYEGSGLELMRKFWNQAKSCGTEFLSSEVQDIRKDNTGFVIILVNEKVVHSKTLIIALGTEKRKLNIAGEDKFIGKGVSYCATCDATFFKNKQVAVIGGGNSAVKAAVLLSKLASKVYIICRKCELKCDKIENSAIKEIKNIELVYDSAPVEIKGKEKVSSLVLDIKGKKQELEVDGIFVEIGAIPVTDMTKELGIETDNEKYIIVDNEMRTNVKGVFAAGDTIKSKLKQVVISAGQGAIAAHSVREFLSGRV